jgi:hypothetical protein
MRQAARHPRVCATAVLAIIGILGTDLNPCYVSIASKVYELPQDPAMMCSVDVRWTRRVLRVPK